MAQVQWKPKCRLIGEDGNIFSILGRASRALRDAGLEAYAKEMEDKVFASGSYDEAVQTILRYVEAE